MMTFTQLSEAAIIIKEASSPINRLKGSPAFRLPGKMFNQKLSQIKDEIQTFSKALNQLLIIVEDVDQREDLKQNGEMVLNWSKALSSTCKAAISSGPPENEFSLNQALNNIETQVEAITNAISEYDQILNGEEMPQDDPNKEIKDRLIAELSTLLIGCNLSEDHIIAVTFKELIEINPFVAQLEYTSIIEHVRKLWIGNENHVHTELLLTEINERIEQYSVKGEVEKETYIAPLNCFLEMAGAVGDDDLDAIWTSAAYFLPHLLTLSEDNPAVKLFMQSASQMSDGLQKQINYFKQLSEMGIFSMGAHGLDYMALKEEIGILYSIKGFCELLVPHNEHLRRQRTGAQMAFRKFIQILEESKCEDIVDKIVESGELFNTPLNRSRYAGLIPPETYARLSGVDEEEPEMEEELFIPSIDDIEM